MKCQICGKRTTVEKSVGFDEFIVCNKCHDILTHGCIDNSFKVMDFIFTCGKIRQSQNKK